VPIASQGISEQSPEAGAGAGDENHLLGIHDHPLLATLPRTSLMPEVKPLVTRNKFNGLPARSLSENSSNLADQWQRE
jgi:hypothetical protein